jgi:hypothetical protein
MKELPRSPSRTTTGFAFSILDRAIREGFSERKFGKAEKQRVVEFFGQDPPECAYCGNHDVGRWDHLIPIRNGGDTVLGNMVLACSRCDDSKQHLDFEEWMRGNSKFSPASQGVPDLEDKIDKIKSYIHRHGYGASSLESRLDGKENEKLADLETRLQSIRNDLEALVRSHRDRTGKDQIY